MASKSHGATVAEGPSLDKFFRQRGEKFRNLVDPFIRLIINAAELLKQRPSTANNRSEAKPSHQIRNIFLGKSESHRKKQKEDREFGSDFGGPHGLSNKSGKNH